MKKRIHGYYRVFYSWNKPGCTPMKYSIIIEAEHKKEALEKFNAWVLQMISKLGHEGMIVKYGWITDLESEL